MTDRPNSGYLAAAKERGDLLAAAALLFLGSLAFIRLLVLPAFEDEGSELRLIWRVIEAGDWLLPLSDGKPLDIWPMVLPVELGFHPLTSTRALHVLAGMAGAVLTYRLARELVDRRTAFVSGVLFAICPFVVYLERLALSDMFLCTAGVWVHCGVVRYVKSPTARNAGILAAALVLAAFCKFPVGFVFAVSMPCALVLMPGSERRSLLGRPSLGRLAAAYLPVTSLASVVAMTAIVRMHRGQEPGFGLQDLIGIGGGGYGNIAAFIGIPRMSLIGELTAQLSVPVTMAALVGLLAGAFLPDWRQRWLIAVGAVPMLGIGLFANSWYPRYLLFTLPPLIIAAVSGWRRLVSRVPRYRRLLAGLLLMACVGFLGHQSVLLILDPLNAKWSALDRFQYFEGWGSGYGYPQAARFLLESTEAPPSIYSLDGHSAHQLLSYLPAAWRSRVTPIFYGRDSRFLGSDEARLENLLDHAPVWIIVPDPLLQGYLVSSFGQRNLGRIKLRPIVKFDKPGVRVRLAIYEATR